MQRARKEWKRERLNENSWWKNHWSRNHKQNHIKQQLITTIIRWICFEWFYHHRNYIYYLFVCFLKKSESTKGRKRKIEDVENPPDVINKSIYKMTASNKNWQSLLFAKNQVNFFIYFHLLFDFHTLSPSGSEYTVRCILHQMNLEDLLKRTKPKGKEREIYVVKCFCHLLYVSAFFFLMWSRVQWQGNSRNEGNKETLKNRRRFGRGNWRIWTQKHKRTQFMNPNMAMNGRRTQKKKEIRKSIEPNSHTNIKQIENGNESKSKARKKTHVDWSHFIH